MITIEASELTSPEWNNMVSSMRGLSLVQTWEFGEAREEKRGWEVQRFLFKCNAIIISAAQVMIRRMPYVKRGLVWINRAPLFINEEVIENGMYVSILEELRKYWVDERKMYLRIALPLDVSEKHYKLIGDAGFSRATPFDGWASERVDLSMSVEDLRKKFSRGWRRGLFSAEHNSISIEIGSSSELISEAIADFQASARNNEFDEGVTTNYIKLFKKKVSDEKIVIFGGRHNGKKIGSIAVVMFGNTCMGLAGAAHDIGKRLGLNYYLHWTIMCEMKKRGYRWYDVGGTHPYYTSNGIRYFKGGMRGAPYQLVGEADASCRGLLEWMIKKSVNLSRGI